MEYHLFIQVIAAGAIVSLVIMSVTIPLVTKIGTRRARIALRGGIGVFGLATAGALVYARLGGEWADFAKDPGVGTLFELLGFFGAFITTAYFLGSRHIATTLRLRRESGEDT